MVDMTRVETSKNAPTSQNDGCSTDSLNEMAMVDALAAKDTMFKPTIHTSTKLSCPWPINIVTPSNFTFTTPESISTPPELPQRSFEYGASWVEHYYARLIVECKKHNRMDLVLMLYRWYIAQFTIDYLNDIQPLSSEQFLAASNVLFETTSLNELSDKARGICMACRELMKLHDDTLKALSVNVSKNISFALGDFYSSVAKQCSLQVDEKQNLDSMTLQEYMEYRTLNAGGLMGFVRQVHLLSLLDPQCPIGEMETISMLVGLNIALMNDLYGVKKDLNSGEPNIILKHSWEMQCDIQESVAWAATRIKGTVMNVQLYNKLHPNCISLNYDIAMNCISGNHGFHESSKRYELPAGFSWCPDAACFERARSACRGDDDNSNECELTRTSFMPA